MYSPCTPYSLTITFTDGYQLENVEMLDEYDDCFSVSATPTEHGVRGYVIPKDKVRFITWIQ